MNLCRFCKNKPENEKGSFPILHYSVRHTAHADCLLKAKGAQIFGKVRPHVLKNFPYMAVVNAGLKAEFVAAYESRVKS